MQSKRMQNKLTVAALCVGVGWLLWPDTPTGLLPYKDAAITRQGAGIYGDYCASCHGADLKGQANWRAQDADGYLPAPPHDETGHTWHHPDAQLIAITRDGTEALVGGSYKSRMIGFGGTLSPPEILAVLAFIKSTWPQRVIDAHDRINADAASES